LLLEPFVGLDWVHLEDCADLVKIVTVVTHERASARYIVGQMGNHETPRLKLVSANYVPGPHVKIGIDVGNRMAIRHTFRPCTSKIIFAGSAVRPLVLKILRVRVHGGFIHKMVETVKA
jgi:hypothetical protein